MCVLSTKIERVEVMPQCGAREGRRGQSAPRGTTISHQIMRCVPQKTKDRSLVEQLDTADRGTDPKVQTDFVPSEKTQTVFSEKLKKELTLDNANLQFLFYSKT